LANQRTPHALSRYLHAPGRALVETDLRVRSPVAHAPRSMSRSYRFEERVHVE